MSHNLGCSSQTSQVKVPMMNSLPTLTKSTYQPLSSATHPQFVEIVQSHRHNQILGALKDIHSTQVEILQELTKLQESLILLQTCQQKQQQNQQNDHLRREIQTSEATSQESGGRSHGGNDDEDLKFEQELEGVISLNEFMRAVDNFQSNIATRCINMPLFATCSASDTPPFDNINEWGEN